MDMGRIQVEQYFNDNLLKEYEVVKKYKSYNILKERVELYKDFAINLLYYINDTYLGKEYIKTKHDMEGHFNWCFGKVLDEFYDQDIDFYGNDKLYNYFFTYYHDQFYTQDKPQSINAYKKLWESIFSFKKGGNEKRILELLVELYQIFDESLNSTNKILETL